ncbi:DUF4302 domain-containing protein [Flavobacterium sp. A45]|uniref:DUF4302 domain-containing protein n=1 Tax=Flavobacterium sp. A45 TaxID=1945862 RepID=UPI0009853C76|nr:DUF4302 domain-containing protein [Flavobacterium sp. A45]OOG66762.1 hypothetical protein B0E44_14940 [Flavobacterium sp. A45]
MKTKNTFKYILLTLLALYTGSCSNNTDAEQSFNQTPTERLNAQKKELNDLLLSSEFGWKAVYFTDDTQLGGFTHLFKFLPDNKVEMASDFDTDTNIYTSTYDLVLGSSVSLLFDSANRIHLLSDASKTPKSSLKGKGYLGDFQFLYFGQENGDLIFKSNRLVREVRFVKATAQDWVDLPKNLEIEQILNKSNFVWSIQTNDGTEIKKYEFSFDKATRYANCRSLEAGSSEVLGFGVGYTPTGIVVSPAVEVAGQKLTDFVYNATDSNFTATGAGGVTAIIKGTYTSTQVLTDDYKLVMNNQNQLFAYLYSHTKKEAENSELFLNIVKQIESDTKLMVHRIQFNFNTDKGNYIEYKLGETDGKTVRRRIFHYFTYTIDESSTIITLHSSTWKQTKIDNLTDTAPTIDAPTGDNAMIKALDDEFMRGFYITKNPKGTPYTYQSLTITGATEIPFKMITYLF